MIAVEAPVFADFSAAAGAQFGIMMESAGNTHSTLYAPGGAISLFSIEEGSFIGFFAHFSFLVPAAITNSGDVSLDFYDFLFLGSFTAGPGFKIELGDTFRLNIGAGINVLGLLSSATITHEFYDEYQYSHTMLNIGAGLVVELSFEKIAPFYIALGLTFSYDFLNYSESSSPQGTVKGWTTDYALFAPRPYICFGYHFDDPVGDD
ncbi:MAG: hypothetical protein LBG74_04005 [Spirochaetaceae bacterium]|nr:hypothetical protein [Spirochaetaceae bacterium]